MKIPFSCSYCGKSRQREKRDTTQLTTMVRTAASSVVCLIIASFFSSTSATIEPKDVTYDHGQALTKWLLQHGGKIHPGLQLERSSPGAPFYGIQSTNDIKKGELLMEIPRSFLATPEEMQDGDRVEVVDTEDEETTYLGTIVSAEQEFYHIHYDTGNGEERIHADFVYHLGDCTTVQRLYEKVQSNKENQLLEPYLNYLLSQPERQLPAAWSDEGKALLNEVLGHNPGITIESRTLTTPLNSTAKAVTGTRAKFPPLPPYMRYTEELNRDFIERCQGGKDTSDTPALLNLYHLLVQRGWDDVMIPVFDLMCHGNGRLLNTDHASIRTFDERGYPIGLKDDPVRVWASRDIRPGEELCTTYNLCTDCENRFMGYGTPELMRDYGFVESFPQRWFLDWPVGRREKPVPVGYELDWVDGEYKVTWLSQKLSHPTLVRFARNHIRRLEVLNQTVFVDGCPNDVPEHECQTIQQYHQAASVALREALKASGRGVQEEEDVDCQHADGAGFCTPPEIEGIYDNLQVKEKQWVQNRPDTCDEGENNERSPYYTNTFHVLETIESPYQVIKFGANLDRNNDMCLSLDDVNQICTSYRPEYHEMAVHNPARYLEGDLKRVAFVGGGDSMLLYDIVKYPTLEKVIGLEIDQFVTRGSFKHFGTQPLWDQHEKVEWWFGDASKSLPMLPRDYFGSFDMVLVDLSETVASMSVTDDLNIMEALSLLLHPNGILVKNEYHYFEEQSRIYENTLHIHWYQIPYVCSQSFIYASNAIDFMRAKYRIRDVKHILPLLDKPDIQYGYVHDFQKNYNHSQLCLDSSEDINEPAEQKQSPGIMMVIEAETAEPNLLSLESIAKSVVEALKKQDFNVLSTLTPSEVNAGVVIFILEEGYVVARSFPDEEYCAFDFQLWASYVKQDAAKKALIEAVGSKVGGGSSSSYRIVSGGMFGAKTWKQDEKKRGPKLKKCDAPATPQHTFNKPAELSATAVAMRESLALVKGSDFSVLVMCGQDSNCAIAEDLKNGVAAASNVMVLQPCPAMSDGVEFMPDASKKMANCEVETWSMLNAFISESGKRIRSILVDPSAPQSLAQIILKLIGSPVNKRRFLDVDMMVAAPVIDFSETWRRAFVDKFRTEIFPVDPTFQSDIYVNSTASSTSFIMSLAHSGDKDYAEYLVHYAEKLEKVLNSAVEIRRIRGNVYHGFSVQVPIDTSVNFTDAHFAQTDNLKQWYDQKPLGLQVLFQFELQKKSGEEQLTNAFKDTISSRFVVKDPNAMEYKAYSDLGEGLLLVTVWKEGTAILLYDGRSHLDVNLFLYEEDFSSAYKFEDDFTNKVPGMSRTLRDTQPRGTGRVINFRHDLEEAGERPKPTWQTSLEGLVLTTV